MKEKHYLTPLLEPRSVGIIGASEREASLGSVLMRNMLEAGYKGKLFAINPKHEKVHGVACYKSVEDVPQRLDRADGDVHAAGNPHIQTDPRNIALVAEPLARRLAELDPANASVYQARSADFMARWKAAIQRWDKEAAPLRGVPVVVQHKAFPYLQQWLGLVEVAALGKPLAIFPLPTGLLGGVDQARRVLLRKLFDQRCETHTDREQASHLCAGQQGDIAHVIRQRRVFCPVQENQVLHREFGVNHGTGAVLDIKAVCGNRMGCAHALAHRHHLGLER